VLAASHVGRYGELRLVWSAAAAYRVHTATFLSGRWTYVLPWAGPAAADQVARPGSALAPGYAVNTGGPSMHSGAVPLGKVISADGRRSMTS